MVASRWHVTLARAASPLLAAGALTLFGCTDRTTAPSITPSADKGGNAPPASGVSTLAWEKMTRDLVSSHKLTPTNAIRVYALHSIAQYAGVVAVDRAADDEDDDRGGGRANWEARRGAIAGASAEVLSFLMPDAATALEAQVVADGSASTGRTHPQFTRGVAVGRAAGDAMIAWAQHDGFSLVWDESMRNASGVGIWEGAPAVPPAARPAPVGYQFPSITPYFLKVQGGHSAQSQFRSASPPTYSLLPGHYQTDLGEVKQISLTRTQAQIDIANFWNLPPGTPTALGHWDETASQLMSDARYGELEASHLFALINAAGMDATIGCWETKFHYFMLRPTMADPTITTVYPLPNHPSYPSGHSCVSSAAATVLSAYFPSHSAQLNADVIQAGLSRIYGGIHYRFDVEAGQTLGLQTAQWAMSYDQEHGLLSAVGLGGEQGHEGHH